MGLFLRCYFSMFSLVLGYMCLVYGLCDDYHSVICYLSIRRAFFYFCSLGVPGFGLFRL